MSTQQHDAMISYSWHYKKDTVDRLYNYLTSKGHKIWKDDEGGLQGHLVDGMADAIERSKVILVCLSEKYFSSKNCKLELEYAHEMEKQIVVIKLDPLLKLTGHGALSMILAKQLYLENDDEELLFQAVHHRLAGNSSKAISVPTAMKPLNFANLKNFETSTDYKYIVAYDNLPQYKTISFECEISNDIHIGIAKSPRHKDPKYEIVIGGWRGTKSVIRDRNQGENLISTVHEYPFFVQLRKKFYLEVNNGNIKIINASTKEKFIEMTRSDIKKSELKYLLISTGFGGSGTWKISAK